jgi:ssDNA-binding Zn-finger/Zn-ribbon topoisomerase 1
MSPKRKADRPLCLRCGCDDEDMVERHEHKVYTEFFCNSCSFLWRVSKTSEE